MKLEIKTIKIGQLQPGSETSVKDHVLTVNTEELREHLLTDKRISSVEVHLIYPGDKTRVLNVQDVVQPRAKTEEQYPDFPGWVDGPKIAGSGTTVALEGVHVVISNASTKRIESGILDMAGPMMKLSKFSNTPNVCIVSHIADGVEEREFEDAVKKAGFKAAVYLAQAAATEPADKIETFEMEMFHSEYPDLPRIAYIFQSFSPQFDYLAESDKTFYGRALTGTLPIVVHPNELIDGALVGWNAMKSINTAACQNNAIIKELYKNHGKNLDFAGVILASANTDADNRNRNCQIVASMAKNILNADGVVISKILGGMPHLDISSMGVACEKLGIKTCVASTPLTAKGTLGDTILFNDEELNLIIAGSAPFERTVIDFEAETFIGGNEDTLIYSSEMIKQRAGDKRLNIEQYLLSGVHDDTGSLKIIVKEF